MPAITPIQQSFSSGEITPEMYRRRALQVQRNQRPIAEGVSVLNNFITDPRGPVRSRVGFRYLGLVVADDGPTEPTEQRVALIGQFDWTASTDGYDNFIDPMTPSQFTSSPTSLATNNRGLFAVEAGDAIDRAVFTTTDGTTWTKRTHPAPTISTRSFKLIWDEKGQRWVTSCRHPANGGPELGVYIRASTDLVTWTTLYEDPANDVHEGIATDGNGTFLAGSSRGITIMYSNDDGVSWSEINPLDDIGGSQESGKASWAHDRWYMTGKRAALHHCEPGTDPANPANWTLLQSTGNLFDKQSPVYAGFDQNQVKRYVSFRTLDQNEADTLLFTSVDGLNFNTFSPPAGMQFWPPAYAKTDAVAYDSNYGWICVWRENIFVSQDTITWTAAPDDNLFTQLAWVGVGLKAP